MRRKSSLIANLFNMDVLFGILLGIMGPFLIWVTMQDAPVATQNAVLPDNVIYAYQSLIAGIMALIGAAFALVAIRHQIHHATEIENERRWRRNNAARSVMPHALSSLSTYARECCVALMNEVDEYHPPKETADVHLG